MHFQIKNDNLGEEGSKIEVSGVYFVYVWHDDFTPREFVVHVLEMFFYMNRQRAVEVMSEIHHKGNATVGAFSRDVAETKISQVLEYARRHEHPLNCSMETAAV